MVVAGFGVVALVLLGTLVFAIRRLTSQSPLKHTDANWLDYLSVERYRPMMLLLEPQELQRLAAQPGITPGMAAGIRRRRIELFRRYLRSLAGDFGQVCGAVKLLMLCSENDRPELAAILLRSQLHFACALMGIRVRLVLFQYGIGAPDVAGLLKLFGGIRLELGALVPVPALSA